MMASNKRKASEFIDSASIGNDERSDNEEQLTNMVLDLKDSPESIADAILRAGRNNNNEIINSLLQAAHLAEACINERKRRKLREEAAQRIGSWPKEVLLKVFEYVPKRELVHNASLVCKQWRDTSRSPLLWSTLDDAETGTLRFDKEISSLDEITDLLSRPQLSMLKIFQPPRSMFLIHSSFQNSFQTISRLSFTPHLEEINVWNGHIHPSTLMELPDLFPKLSKFKVTVRDLWDPPAGVTGQDLVDFCEKMGNRLLQLSICDEQSFAPSALNNSKLCKISSYCPNLEFFHLHSRFTCERRLGVTVSGVRELLQNCPRVRILELVMTTTGTSTDFPHVIESGKSLRRLLLVGFSSISSFAFPTFQRAFRDREEFNRFRNIYLLLDEVSSGPDRDPDMIREITTENARLLRECGYLTRVDVRSTSRARLTHNPELDIQFMTAQAHKDRMDACRVDRSQTYLGQKWCYD